MGAYCPECSVTPGVCPPGRFWDVDPGLKPTADDIEEGDECRRCTPGYYCPGANMIGAPTLQGDALECDEGFYCANRLTTSNGSVVSAGARVANPSAGVCPAGHFCQVSVMHRATAPTRARSARSAPSALISLSLSLSCTFAFAAVSRYCWMFRAAHRLPCGSQWLVM